MDKGVMNMDGQTGPTTSAELLDEAGELDLGKEKEKGIKDSVRMFIADRLQQLKKESKGGQESSETDGADDAKLRGARGSV
jgi:hypothetical protein